MRILSLVSAAIWVDFIVMVIAKILPGQHLWFLPPTHALNMWYDQFGVAAVAADVLSLILGVMVAMFLFPGAVGLQLVAVSVFVQLLHDIFFYFVVIRGLPAGHNAMIDVFKTYANEGGWTILLADALMMTSVVVIAEISELMFTTRWTAFKALLGAYALIYITYTK